MSSNELDSKSDDNDSFGITMPAIFKVLPEASESASRLVILDIVNQIKKITEINPNARVLFPGDLNKIRQAGSGIEDLSREAILANNNFLFIEVDEDYNLDAVNTTAITQYEYTPVFSDRNLGVTIRPVYVQSDVSINVKYRCTSKNEAKRWRDEIRLRMSIMRTPTLHTATYHYLLSKSFYHLLQVIHQKREAVAGYNESFEDYLLNHSTGRLTVLGDLANKNTALAISERQNQIVGNWNFEGFPEKIEKEDEGTWAISFNFRFNYQRPAAAMMRYPIIVHNQLLAKQYIALPNDQTNLYQRQSTFSNSLGAMSQFEAQLQAWQFMRPGQHIRIPDYDDFVLKDPSNSMGTVFVALCTVDPKDQKTILNLNELGDIRMDADVLKFIQEVEYPYVTNPFQSVIQFYLYRGNDIVGETLTCDQDLNLIANKPLDLRYPYRIRLSLVTDLALLNQATIERWENYPAALAKVIGGINELLRDNPWLRILANRTKVTPLDFKLLYRMACGFTPTGKKGNKSWYLPIPNGELEDYRGQVWDDYKDNAIQFNRVQLSSIIALKRE